jgi:predicted nuclease of predicted toxin-antitoxin system
LPRSAAALLCDMGIDTVHVAAIGLSRAEDGEILAEGRKLDCAIVTLDADFHTMLALTEATSPSVVRIRIEGLRAEAIAQLLKTVVDQCEGDLRSGAMVTVQETRIRIRRLPLLHE